MTAVYDASNPEHVAKREKEEADRENDLGFIMSKERGRRWLYDLIWEKCHYGMGSHVPGDADSSAYNEGARAIGIVLHDAVRDHSPKYYLKMVEENQFNG